MTRGIDLPADERLAVEASRFAVTAVTAGVADGPRTFPARRGRRAG